MRKCVILQGFKGNVVPFIIMDLQTYYKTTVVKNETMTGGWAPNYYGVFSAIINENNYKTIAEIGIGYGTHAKYILKTTNVDKIYLIDPMKFYENDLFATDIMAATPVIPGNNFNELYGLINDYLSEYSERYTWFRNESLAIQDNQIADETLDCIFIDGDHTYNAVFADLEFWWKKLRVGGQILGDDYWMESVSSAVKDFSKKYNLRGDLLKKEGTNYSIYRFHK